AKIKNQYPDILWIGIIYSFFDNSILKLFDDTFSIIDDISIIIRKINSLCNNNFTNSNESGQLSERETDVLHFIAKGFSNKETADKLNISIHTVNTHRKNIMEKTGIRSLAGLTIYAVSKGIISID
ncbi:MAG: helix-turn-helix transcriptional regulator, partial [Bacteroidales bacterium]|nr:helix-turn-helix transcriptional regulator [Bacteroidales bacterium]